MRLVSYGFLFLHHFPKNYGSFICKYAARALSEVSAVGFPAFLQCVLTKAATQRYICTTRANYNILRADAKHPYRKKDVKNKFICFFILLSCMCTFGAAHSNR